MVTPVPRAVSDAPYLAGMNGKVANGIGDLNKASVIKINNQRSKTNELQFREHN